MSDVLVLNFSYEPLETVQLERAVQLIYEKKAEIIHALGGAIRSVSWSTPIPKIIRMLYYIKTKARQRVALSKKHIHYRDNNTCGYCGHRGATRSMTLDHVFPKSRGGKNSWTNLVTCCIPCNQRKRDRTPEEAGMKLRLKPYEPKYIPWMQIEDNTEADEWVKLLTLYNISI